MSISNSHSYSFLNIMVIQLKNEMIQQSHYVMVISLIHPNKQHLNN